MSEAQWLSDSGQLDRYSEGIETCTGVTYDADDNEVACDFEGEVELVTRPGLYFWTCPKCGTEHGGYL